MARVASCTIHHFIGKLTARIDYPIKRFAQRHVFGATDAIAARDLGFAIVRQQTQTRTSGQSRNCSGSQSQTRSHSVTREIVRPHTGQLPIRATPLESDSSYQRRERDEPGYRRGRGASPARRELRAGHDATRASASPGTNGHPGVGQGRTEHGSDIRSNRSSRQSAPAVQHTRSQVQVPVSIKEFTGTLPTASSFNGFTLNHHLRLWRLTRHAGPMLHTDDILRVFRNVTIPNATYPHPVHSHTYASRRGVRSERPLPDYGPYQGPDGRRRGERY